MLREWLISSKFHRTSPFSGEQYNLIKRNHYSRSGFKFPYYGKKKEMGKLFLTSVLRVYL